MKLALKLQKRRPHRNINDEDWVSPFQPTWAWPQFLTVRYNDVHLMWRGEKLGRWGSHATWVFSPCSIFFFFSAQGLPFEETLHLSMSQWQELSDMIKLYIQLVGGTERAKGGPLLNKPMCLLRLTDTVRSHEKVHSNKSSSVQQYRTF